MHMLIFAAGWHKQLAELVEMIDSGTISHVCAERRAAMDTI